VDQLAAVGLEGRQVRVGRIQRPRHLLQRPVELSAIGVDLQVVEVRILKAEILEGV